MIPIVYHRFISGASKKENFMLRSMTIEEISKRPNAIRLGDIQTITMFYDPVNDEIILNSEHHNYDAILLLAEAYLEASPKKRERFKATNILPDEIKLLDEVIQTRSLKEESEKFRQQYSKEFKMIGSETAFWEHIDFIDDMRKFAKYPEIAGVDIFNRGYIQGKRAERASRRKNA